ncbi:MAG: hypothetical protein P4L99_11545 [Chthoniobacter sp.]|nr:hypothetical protein [Chthoniobacter sp.]
MNIYIELSKVGGDGLIMLETLKQAALAGHSRAEALEALQRLYDEASAQGRQQDEDNLVDLMDIAKNSCLPRGRVWKDQYP